MRNIILRGVIALFGAIILSGAAMAETNQPNDENIQRVMSTPMEPLLPCTPKDDLIVYTLKAADGFNIQVAIECNKGTLTAKWPLEPVKPETDNEAP